VESWWRDWRKAARLLAQGEEQSLPEYRLEQLRTAEKRYHSAFVRVFRQVYRRQPTEEDLITLFGEPVP